MTGLLGTRLGVAFRLLHMQSRGHPSAAVLGLATGHEQEWSTALAPKGDAFSGPVDELAAVPARTARVLSEGTRGC